METFSVFYLVETLGYKNDSNDSSKDTLNVSRLHPEDSAYFYLAAGLFLKKMRQKAGLTPDDVFNSIPKITRRRLIRYEQGLAKFIPACFFFSLIHLYGANKIETELVLQEIGRRSRLRSIHRRYRKDRQFPLLLQSLDVKGY